MSTVYAHNFSASESDLKVEDGLSRLTIRMPMFELEHLPQSGRQLADYFRIAGTGPVSQSCRQEGESWVCRATFLATPGTIESRLAEASVPQHVHTMHYADRTLVFTAEVASLEGRAISGWTLLLVPIGMLIVLPWVIRSLRSRRKISHPG